MHIIKNIVIKLSCKISFHIWDPLMLQFFKGIMSAVPLLVCWLNDVSVCLCLCFGGVRDVQESSIDTMSPYIYEYT